MRGMRLDELIGRLRRGGLDLTAEQVADAIWLARRLGDALPRDAPGRPGSVPSTEPAAGTDQLPGTPADQRTSDGRQSGDREAPSAAVPLHASAAGAPGAAALDGARSGSFPVRAPAATALPGLLGLEKALRALGRYRVAASTPRTSRSTRKPPPNTPRRADSSFPSHVTVPATAATSSC